MSKFLIVIGIVCAYLAWNKHKHQLISLKRIPTSVVSCESKPKCLVVYVAPWCSACHSLTPILQSMHSEAQKSDKFGVKIIVGGGRSPAENKTMADLYGEQAVIDEDSTLRDSLQIAYYPTIYGLNANQEIISKDNDALTWADIELKKKY